LEIKKQPTLEIKISQIRKYDILFSFL